LRAVSFYDVRFVYVYRRLI